MLDLTERFDFEGRAVAWGADGDGPPIVLIHGTPFSAQVWRRIAPALARTRRVFVFDLFGYGRSEKRAGADVSLGVQNRLLAALVRNWGLDPPEVVAHDIGGATALRAWALDDLRYRRLTLVDPVVLSPWGSPFLRHARAHEAAFAGLPPTLHEALVRAYLEGAVAQTVPEETTALHVAPWLGPAGQPAFYAQIAQMDERHTGEIAHDLAAVDFPVTLLWGENDAWLPLAQGRALAERLTGGALRVVRGAGHLVPEEAPEEIVAAVLA